jgi:hypothetical protein
MFRRLPASLPDDPGRHFAKVTTFDELGYFINEHGQIRKKDNPTEQFVYRVNSDERFNEVRRTAFNCKPLECFPNAF